VLSTFSWHFIIFKKDRKIYIMYALEVFIFFNYNKIKLKKRGYINEHEIKKKNNIIIVVNLKIFDII